MLEASITALHRHLTDQLSLTWRLTIADNASTDATPQIADDLARRLPHVRVLHRQERGRGGALRQAWTTSDAPVLAYVDADLSTDLDSLRALLHLVAAGQADVAIGSRLASGAQVQRSTQREAISRAYNLMVRAAFRAPFRDAQCGCKVISRSVAEQLLPQVADDGWFFDTELLLLAQRAGLRIHELPVTWVEDPRSSVRLLSTAAADLRGLARVARTTHTPQR